MNVFGSRGRGGGNSSPVGTEATGVASVRFDADMDSPHTHKSPLSDIESPAHALSRKEWRSSNNSGRRSGGGDPRSLWIGDDANRKSAEENRVSWQQ